MRTTKNRSSTEFTGSTTNGIVMESRKQLQVYIPLDLQRRVKSDAASKGLHMADVVREALADYYGDVLKVVLPPDISERLGELAARYGVDPSIVAAEMIARGVLEA